MAGVLKLNLSLFQSLKKYFPKNDLLKRLKEIYRDVHQLISDMKSSFNTQCSTTLTTLKRTKDSLHDLLDSWKWRIEQPKPEYSTGCASIDRVAYGLYPGDLYVVAGDYAPYFDSVARGMMFSAMTANRDVIIIGEKSSIRNFWCEAFARELVEPVSRVAMGNLSEEKWKQANEFVNTLIQRNNIVTSVVSGYRLNYLETQVKNAMAACPDTAVLLIEGCADSDYYEEGRASPIGRCLKALAQYHDVCIILSLGLNKHLKGMRLTQVFNSESEIPACSDVIILCEQVDSTKRGVIKEQRKVNLYIEGRSLTTRCEVPIDLERVARLDKEI